MGNKIQKMAFPYPNPPYNFRTQPEYISNSRGDRIPILYFPISLKQTSINSQKNKEDKEDKEDKDKNQKKHKLIIFSHGNATDLAASEYFLLHLRDQFNVSVLGYEYLGYGHSYPTEDIQTSSIHTSDYPSEDGCYESLAMTWNHARRVLGYEAADIVLMGQSIGSGPTCEIAERVSINGRKPKEETCDNEFNEDIGRSPEIPEYKLGGVILVSPFRTAAKVVTKNPIGYFVDFFCNEDKISNIAAPILIIHGTSDCVIPYEHAEHMVNVCHRQEIRCVDLCPVQGADHNDIFERKETSDAINKFLSGKQL